MSRHNRRAYVPPTTPLVDTFTQYTRPAADAVMAGLNAPDKEPTMKIQFTSVMLKETAPRLDGGRGQATQDTTFFDAAKAGVVIEYDTATSLVRISKGTACFHVPIGEVKRFGPTLGEAVADAQAREEYAAETRRNNAEAAEAAARIAQMPAAGPIDPVALAQAHAVNQGATS